MSFDQTYKFECTCNDFITSSNLIKHQFITSSDDFTRGVGARILEKENISSYVPSWKLSECEI